jgi:hypothetical protein
LKHSLGRVLRVKEHDDLITGDEEGIHMIMMGKVTIIFSYQSEDLKETQ